MMETAEQDLMRFAILRAPDRAQLARKTARVVHVHMPMGSSIAGPQTSAVFSRPGAPALPHVPDVTSADVRAFLAQHGTLVALDEWLAAHADALDGEEVKRWLRNTAGGTSLEDATPRKSTSQAMGLLLLGCARKQGLDTERDTLLRLMQVLALLDAIFAGEAKTAKEIASFLASVVLAFPSVLLPPSSGLARRPLVADLKVLRTKLVGYLPGELAYIENVMPGERRVRSVSQVRDSVEVRVSETLHDSESTRESSSSDRFALEKEVQQTSSDDLSFNAGLSISASYGTAVSATASTDFAMNSSYEESTREATRYAREIVERATAKVRQRTLERRSSTVRETLTQLDRHGIRNTAQGAKRVVGLYRWVDKIYEAQIYSCGRRLILDFVVPDPAALYLTAIRERRAAGVTAVHPREPTVTVGSLTRRFTAQDVTEDPASLHLALASEYQTSGLVPPPAARVTVASGFEDPFRGTESPAPDTPARLLQSTRLLKVPEGYRATRVTALVYADDWRSNVRFAAFGIDIPASAPLDPNGNSMAALPGTFVYDVPATVPATGDVPIALYIRNTWGYTITVHLECERLPATLARWQNSTYESILLAYYQLKREYEAQVAAAETRTASGLAEQSDAANRDTERSELRRGVISLLMRQNLEGAPLAGSATTWQTIPSGPTPDHTSSVSLPAIDFQVAAAERDSMQWFEQSFEWRNMMYAFYPYFWKDRSTWLSQLNTHHPDPLFATFLRSGAARVQVPVRPGFEQAMLFYLATGILWKGTRVPQSGDPLYVSLVAELQEQLQAPDEGVAEGRAWPVRLPTALVWLSDEEALPAPPSRLVPPTP